MLLRTRNGWSCSACLFRASRYTQYLQSLLLTSRHDYPGARWNASGRHSSTNRHLEAQLSRKLKNPTTLQKQSRAVRRKKRVQHGSTKSRSGKWDIDKSTLLHNDYEADSTYNMFGRLLQEQANALQSKLLRRDMEGLRAWDITSRIDLLSAMRTFRKLLEECIRSAERGEPNALFQRLRGSFVDGNMTSLMEELKHSFISFMVDPKLKMTSEQLRAQQRLADLRYPTEWYPATRAMQRTIHLHIGPTNSGKTYHALQRLEAAESGIYAGPLRLLAHEVYTRFNAKGKLCALVTGEEKRIPQNLNSVMQSCTVEMIPLNRKVDVAVIDEIQMLGDEERGWAWTQALLGVQAKEVHLCGEVRTEKLIRDICALTGDKLIVHRYERLNPLEVEEKSLHGKLQELRKGDAIILFSRVAIHGMKASIEKVTGKRCAVVYGSLPPETRAQQAALFNDPDNDYHFLVASDAVGMGLNLSIRRVVFEATSKNDGYGHRVMRPWEIKQIAGRAGRYKTAHEAVRSNTESDDDQAKLDLDITPLPKKSAGYVTTLDAFDLPILRKAMEEEVKPLKSALILPPHDAVLQFATYFPPDIPFSYIWLRLYKQAAISPLFDLCRIKDQVQVADLIQHIPLSNSDRMTFMSAPVALRDVSFPAVVVELAECVANHSGGELLNLKTLDIELLDLEINQHADGSRSYLKAAESLHKALTLYLWLSYRYAGVFRSQALAFYTKSLVEQKIDECLAEVQWDSEHRRREREQQRQSALLRSLKAEKAEKQLIDSETALLEKSQNGELADGTDISPATSASSAEDVSKHEDEDLDGRMSKVTTTDDFLPPIEQQDRQDERTS